jgi:hypothetical protein
VATLLGSLLVSLGLESGEFKSGLSATEKQMRATQKRIEGIGKGMVDLGGKLSLAVTAPLAALATASVKAALESQDAIGQVNQALATMGNQAGHTSEQLQGLASGIMRKSLYDDDEILRSVTANMLTFGKIAGAEFDRAQQAAVDLAARLGGDLQGAALQIGKALNDPVKGITALTRAGVSFTAQQKEQIKSMVAAGKTAEAQRLILSELEKQFGGSAEAARKADPFAAMKQSFAEFQETVGAELLKAMPAITGAITGLLEAFNSLSPGMQKFLIVAGAVGATLGPVLIVVGSLVSAIAPLIAGVTTLAGVLGGLGPLLGVVVSFLGGFLAGLAPILVPLAAVAAAVTAVYLAWKNWDTIKGWLLAIGSAVSNFWNGTVQPVLDALANGLSTIVKAWWNLHVQAALALARLAGAVREWIVGKLGAVWDWLKGKLKAVGQWFFDLYDAVVGHSYIPDMVDGIGAEMAKLDKLMVEPARKATDATKQAFRDLASDVNSILQGLFPAQAKLKQQLEDIAKIQAAVKAGQVDPFTGAMATDAIKAEMATDRRDALGLGADTGEVTGKGLGPISDESLSYAVQRIADTLRPLPDLINHTAERLGELGEAIGNQLMNGIADWLTGDKSLGDALRDGLHRVLQDGIRQSLRDLEVSVFGEGGLGGFLGKGLKSLIGGAFANGTSFAPGGLSLVGERGPELLNIRRGSQVISNEELRAAMGGGNRQQVHSPTFVFPGVTNAREARESADQAALMYRRRMQPVVKGA